jgi:hypothetical protein
MSCQGPIYVWNEGIENRGMEKITGIGYEGCGKIEERKT